MSSVYQQTKHKRITGFVESTKASKCFNCGGLFPHADIFKGWCAACIAAWGATADPAVIEAARAGYATTKPEPPTAKAYERLKARIAERRPDEWFIPMTLFIGNYTIGQAQANWNFLQALYELEVMTTAEAFKIGTKSYDVLHVCGRHAPMQSMSLASFMGRVIHSDTWSDIEPHLREYIRDFIAQQGIGFQCLTSQRRRIDRWDATHRSHRVYRVGQKPTKSKDFPVVANFWPFAVRQAPTENEMLHAIDMATRGIPEQWRQDVCQDLVVAVLSGETTLDNLRDAIPKHISAVYKMHPVKYCDLALDGPLGWSRSGSHSITLGEMIAATEQEDREGEAPTDAEADRCGWHAGKDRPVGLADMGELARFGWEE